MKKKSFKKGFSTSRGLNRNQMIDEIVKFATMPIEGRCLFVEQFPNVDCLFRDWLSDLAMEKLRGLYDERTTGELKHLLIVFYGCYCLSCMEVSDLNVKEIVLDVRDASAHLSSKACVTWACSFMTVAVALAPSHR